MPSTTVMSLRVFLRTPHSGMPDIAMSREQTDDIIAYILGLRDR
jgi:mono/diheme cytochrome c family protein